MAYTFGSGYVFNSANTTNIDSSKNADNEFLVAYTDVGNSYYGTIQLANVTNDDEVSYGSKYVFDSNNCSKINVRKLDTDKHVIYWEDLSSSAKSRIVTVNVDKTLSFGAVQSGYRDGYADGLAIMSTSSFIILENNSNVLEARYNTVSGTTITRYNATALSGYSDVFDAHCIELDSTRVAVLFTNNSSDTYVVGLSVSGTTITWDSSNIQQIDATANQISARTIQKIATNKTAIFYRKRITSPSTVYSGESNIVTWSSTIPTVGAQYQFDTEICSYCSADSNATDKFSLTYLNNDLFGTYHNGRVIDGSVSGTAITYTNKTNFSSTRADYNSLIFITDSNIAISYNDDNNSDYGTTIIGVGPEVFNFDAIIEYDLDYETNITGSYAFNSTIEYDLDYKSEIYKEFNIEAIINYNLDYETDIYSEYNIETTIEYDLDYETDITAVIDYGYKSIYSNTKISTNISNNSKINTSTTSNTKITTSTTNSSSIKE